MAALAMRLLIVNADDFGLNASATDGIIESHQAGAVTSTTLMANAPDCTRAVTLAQAHPALGVGLHFNLTWGQPLSALADVRSLVDAKGTFHTRNAFALRSLAGRISTQEVGCELAAQLARLNELGISLTHVDSHQHMHAFGPVFEAVARHCAVARIPMRVPWVANDNAAPVARRMRRSLLAWLLKRATAKWHGRVRWNDDIGSVFDLPLQGEPLDDSHYRQLLQRARGVAFELMVHPVTSAAAMEGYTRVGDVGEAEWRYLRTGRLVDIAREEGFRLGTYRDLSA